MKELTSIQSEMLKQMLEWDYEYCFPYSEFNDIADKKVLKKEMRGLIAGGYVEISRGGIDDDGQMFGGTGFSLNYERIGEIRKIVEGLAEKIIDPKSVVTCGDANPTGNVALSYKGGCMKKLDIHDAYRCTGCSGWFHLDCILRHFKLESEHDIGREAQRKLSLEIAKRYTLDQPVGSPSKKIIKESHYKALLRVSTGI